MFGYTILGATGATGTPRALQLMFAVERVISTTMASLLALSTP